MKNTYPSLTLRLFLLLLTLSTSMGLLLGQENPMLNMIGVWDVEAYKTEPAALMDQPGFVTRMEMAFELSVDKRGIIQTSTIAAEGQLQHLTITHFYDAQKNEGHLLGGMGTGIITYPDDQSLVIKQYTFDGELLGLQSFTSISEDTYEGIAEPQDAGQKVKIWLRMTRKK